MNKPPKVHLAAGPERTRCNRLGMRGRRDGEVIRTLAVTGDPAAATCDDCLRLAALDLEKSRPSDRGL